MESGTLSLRLLRLLVVFALPLLLVAAVLPAPRASAGVSSENDSVLTYQVYLCPADYAGEEYLTDCTAGPDPIDILLNGNAGQVDESGTTDTSGYVTFFNIPVGTMTATLQIPGDFASFYYACFDTSSGGEDYLFDGTGNQINQKPSGASGSAYMCRWYVIPESQQGNAPSPSPSAPATPSAIAAIQVYLCPVDYSGDAYLTDCSPTVDPVGVLLSPSVPFDPNDFFAAQTQDDGSIAFVKLDAGDYSVALDIPGEFADFYVACFDATSGSEVYLFDGDTNTVSFNLSEGSTISCRFYVIPENLSGESASPSASASAVPTVSPRASSSAGAINNLPSTGTGAGSGRPTISLALAGLALLALAAVAVAARRLVIAVR